MNPNGRSELGTWTEQRINDILDNVALGDAPDTIDLLPGEGITRTVTSIRTRHGCEVCGEPATRKLTYLLANCRTNPASNAYGRDNCSWCSDAEAFSCEEHQQELRQDPPPGMSWCSTFDGARLPHMLLYWREVTA